MTSHDDNKVASPAGSKVHPDKALWADMGCYGADDGNSFAFYCQTKRSDSGIC
jgi:hypothetical protein